MCKYVSISKFAASSALSIRTSEGICIPVLFTTVIVRIPLGALLCNQLKEQVAPLCFRAIVPPLLLFFQRNLVECSSLCPYPAYQLTGDTN